MVILQHLQAKRDIDQPERSHSAMSNLTNQSDGEPGPPDQSIEPTSDYNTSHISVLKPRFQKVFWVVTDWLEEGRGIM